MRTRFASWSARGKRLSATPLLSGGLRRSTTEDLSNATYPAIPQRFPGALGILETLPLRSKRCRGLKGGLLPRALHDAKRTGTRWKKSACNQHVVLGRKPFGSLAAGILSYYVAAEAFPLKAQTPSQGPGTPRSRTPDVPFAPPCTGNARPHSRAWCAPCSKPAVHAVTAGDGHLSRAGTRRSRSLGRSAHRRTGKRRYDKPETVSGE